MKRAGRVAAGLVCGVAAGLVVAGVVGGLVWILGKLLTYVAMLLAGVLFVATASAGVAVGWLGVDKARALVREHFASDAAPKPKGHYFEGVAP